ncbi:MAG: hypothetical protein OEV06_08985 [Anaerolineae bacterium]|nr:hypothetical protein [Anaerolineae bacterium]
MSTEDTVLVFRGVGPEEFELIKQSGYDKWPPRKPEQPIFYPVTNKQYAEEIASKWNAKADGIGYVLKCRVAKSFLDNYEVHQVGASHHTEWWIPAEDLDQFNANIVGSIEMVSEHRE